MAFPATPLDVTVSLAIGADIHADPATWSWTDVTPLTREKQKISITRGRRSRIGQVVATKCSATVDNTDGNLCRHNPIGTHFGSLKKNTPMKVQINNGSGLKTRAAVFVPGLPPTWDPSERDQTVTLNGVGLLDRIGRGRVLRPALERAILASNPAAYWKLDDGTGAVKAASALPTGAPLTPNNSVAFGASLVPAGATGAANISPSGGFSGPTSIAGGTSTGWEMEIVVGYDTLPTLGSVGQGPTIIGFSTPGGTNSEWGIRLSQGSASDWYLAAYRYNSVTEVGGSMPDIGQDAIVAGRTYHFRVTLTQVGADVSVVLARDGVAIGGGTAVATTLSAPIAVLANQFQFGGSTTKPSSLSNVALWSSVRGSPITYAAADGYDGEMAHDRVERLCTEERIRISTTATTSVTMGPQLTDTLMGNLRACANADLGILYESMDFGLAYLAASQRYNQSAAITLAYDQREILPPWEPTDDDQDYYNDVTATRPDGSPYRAADEDEIDDVGSYAIPANPNVQFDAQAAQVASMLLHLGLNDELTWPAVRPNLYKGGALLDDWLDLEIGDVMHMTGHPSPLAPDTIRQVVEGISETFGAYDYNPSVILSPASVWDAAVADSATLGKADTDGSDLTANITTSGTTLLVATQNASSPLWVTAGGEMPVPLILAGEVMSATAIAAPTTITYGAVGTATHASNASVAPGIPASVATGNLLLCLAAIRNSGTGVPDTPAGYTRLAVFAATDNVQLFGKVATSSGEVAPTITFTGGVANATTSAQMIRIAGAFSDPSEVLVVSNAQLNASAQDIAYPALNVRQANNIIIYLGWKQDDYTSVTSPGTEIAEASSATGDDQSLVWAYTIQTTATNIAAGSFVVTGGASAISRGAVLAIRSNVQSMTVTRNINGLTGGKAHAAGAAVNIHGAAVGAL